MKTNKDFYIQTTAIEALANLVSSPEVEIK